MTRPHLLALALASVLSCGGDAFQAGPAGAVDDSGAPGVASSSATTAGMSGSAGTGGAPGSGMQSADSGTQGGGDGSGGAAGIDSGGAPYDAGIYVDCRGVPYWTPFDINYAVGDLRVHGGQLWRCMQANTDVAYCRLEPGGIQTDISWGNPIGPCDPAQNRDGGVPPPPPVVTMNGCSSDNVRFCEPPGCAITFGVSLTYDRPCIILGTGRTIVFSGDFATYPLVGGTVVGSTTTVDPASPIKSTTGGTSAAFTFPSPGAFGFYSPPYAGVGMKGAVFVRN